MSSSKFIYDDIRFRIRKLRIDINHILYESPEYDHRILNSSEAIFYRRYSNYYDHKARRGGILMSLRTNYADYQRGFINGDISYNEISQFVNQLNVIQEEEDTYDANASIFENYIEDTSSVGLDKSQGDEQGQIEEQDRVTDFPDSNEQVPANKADSNESLKLRNQTPSQDSNDNPAKKVNNNYEGNEDNSEAVHQRYIRSFRLEKLYGQFIEKRNLLKKEFKRKFSSSGKTKKSTSDESDPKSTEKQENPQKTTNNETNENTFVSSEQELKEGNDLNDNKDDSKKESIEDKLENYRLDIIDSADLESITRKGVLQINEESHIVATPATSSTIESWKNVFNEISKNAALVSTGHPPILLKRRIASDFTNLTNYSHFNSEILNKRSSSTREKKTRIGEVPDKDNKHDSVYNNAALSADENLDLNAARRPSSPFSGVSDFVFADYKRYEKFAKDTEDRQLTSNLGKINVVKAESAVEDKLPPSPPPLYSMMNQQNSKQSLR